MYKLNNNSKKPLHIQLYSEIKRDIEQNLKVGDKLPSIRKLSSTYNISKTTVQNAFNQLYAEGYIESRPKSGYYVSELLEVNFCTKPSKIQKEKQKEYIYDFSPTKHHKSYFPLKTWKRLSNQALNCIDFSYYTNGQGEFALRDEIAKYLQNSRGINANAQNIIITSGFIGAMGLVAKLLQKKNLNFAIESPGYYIAENIFKEYGYNIDKIALEAGGISQEELSKSGANLVYITPSHQYPTGTVMPIAKRQKILEYINSVNGYLIEDDYDSELNYTSRPIPALSGIDCNDRVIYVGTFAKALSPAIRVSYLHLPNEILKLYKNHYERHFCTVSIHIQKTLEIFLKEGYFERHLRKIRTQNKKRHDLMLKCIKEELKDSFEIITKGAGIAILIYPKGNFNWEKFKKLLEEEKIKIYFASLCNTSNYEAIRLGFANFDLNEIPKAIKAFSKVWHRVL